MSGFILLKGADDSIDKDISFFKFNDTNLSLFGTGDSAFLAMKFSYFIRKPIFPHCHLKLS